MCGNLENEGLGLGHNRVRTSPLRCGSMTSIGMRLPWKSRNKTRTLHARVWSVLCDLMNYCMMVCMPCCMCVVKCLFD